MKPVAVFCGPTITHAAAARELDAIYLPPAVQGSIVQAVLRYDPSLMILIDGGFQSEPAIKHNEILWAISRGIAVVGAASIGALRAAELYPFMTGVGFIYRWYRRYALAPDDAVAVLHGPAELGFVPLTEAAINLRMTFRAAARAGAITKDVQRELEARMVQMNFRNRSMLRVIAEALPDAGAEEHATISGRINAMRRDQKRADALAALRLAKAGTITGGPPHAFIFTQAFVDDLLAAGINPDAITQP